MTERPLLMCGEMVCATLREVDPKTQTRREVNPQPSRTLHQGKGDLACWFEKSYHSETWKCPYGKPGDRLWVRETFCDIPLRSGKMGFAYRADGESAFDQIEEGYDWLGKWKPSIFMPRVASRITLEIVKVRVERLQDISEQDAKTEGVEPNNKWPLSSSKYRRGFIDIWESINGNGSWAKNPWVWVMEFKRL